MARDHNDPSEALARALIRNVLGGIAIMYAITVAICLYSLSFPMAAGVALLPGVLAGPFLGGLVTMLGVTVHPET
jgi:hypothetical protein